MNTYPLEVRNGHFLATIDERRWLVDTGCPVCIGTGSLTIRGTRIVLRPPVAGFDPEPLTELTGVPVAGVLGTSVLFAEGCCIDAPNGTLTLGSDGMEGPPVPGGLETIFGRGIHILETKLHGKSVRLAVDTGAPLGYMLKERATALPPSGERRRDFIAMSGQWHETPTWMLDLELGGTPKSFRWGILPDDLDAHLGAAGVDGIFGGELCLHQALTFSPGGRGLWVGQALVQSDAPVPEGGCQ